MNRAEYDRLRQHFIEQHGYDDDYFELCELNEPSDEALNAMRWLHIPSLKSKEYPGGCERI